MEVTEPGGDDPLTLDPGQLAATLEVAKAWLPIVAQDSDPTATAEFRTWALAVAKRFRRGHPAWLDAQEMLRRAERAVGQSIRAGQAAGVIAIRGQHPFMGNQHTSKRPSNLNLTSPQQWVPKGTLAGDTRDPGIYRLADGVTDEQFDGALAAARRDGNLSRNHVVRKLDGSEVEWMTPTQRVERIRQLADQGNSSPQIAALIGASPGRVRELGRLHDITIPADLAVKRRSRIDPERILRESINTLQGVVDSLNMLHPNDFEQFTSEQLADWLGALAEPHRALRDLTKEMKAHANHR